MAIEDKDPQTGIAVMRCECGELFQFVCTVKDGNCQGYGAEELHQCVGCKTIESFGRTYYAIRNPRA